MRKFAILLLAALFVGAAAERMNAAVVLQVEAGDYLKFVASAYGYVSGFTQKYPDGSDTPPPLYGGSPGGEFKFLVGYGGQFPTNPTDSDDYLVSFCAQIGEYINYGGVYEVAELKYNVNDFARWIFWGYTTDQESGNVVPDRVSGSSNLLDSDAEAKEIQGALWKALEYSGYDSWCPNYSAWETAYNNDDNWQNSSNSGSAVAVLLKMNDAPAQDQWVFIEGTGNVIIPEPGTLAIWGLLGLLSASACWWQGRRKGRPRGWPEANRTAILEMIERGRLH